MNTNTMRELTDHKLNGLNDALTISVLDEPWDGGACHEYLITGPQMPARPRHEGFNPNGPKRVSTPITFQNGPILEYGVNGVSGEALLAIQIDRLRCFQAGPYACADNAEALDHLEKALAALQRRTKERLARGVEGTSTK